MSPNKQLDLFGEIGRKMGDVERWAKRAGYTCVIGVDEAGRGPLAGPVVTAAVVLDLRRARRGKWLTRLADSKVLSPGERDNLFEHIRAGARLRALAQAEACQIDRDNILNATLDAMARSVAEVSESLDDDERPIVIVDGNRPIPGLPIQRAVVKGDSRSYSVAAASILAKVSRDRILERYERHWPDYGFARHKGYPTIQHRRQVLTLGRCPVHRQSFNVKAF